MQKLIVFTAPSGAGKTTLVKELLRVFPDLAFSVSATTRQKRDSEVQGKDYYFINADEFRALIAQDAFLEWEEVYENQFYGTLRSEVERLWSLGKDVIFDIDVQGAMRIKSAYPDRTLTVFVKPPSEQVLFERLRNRKSETAETLRVRLEKAAYELTFERHFDVVLINEELETAIEQAVQIAGDWLYAAAGS
jgi:guanylate kinase